MATDPNLLRALKSSLRRRYASDLTGLRAECDRVLALATEAVTITSHNFVDGGASGEVSCPRGLYLAALEDTLAELDATAPRGSIAAVCYFRGTTPFRGSLI